MGDDITKIYRSIKWSGDERTFRHRTKGKPLDESSFTMAMKLKFRGSVFGPYLKSFNSQQLQSQELNVNKLGITLWDVTHFDVFQQQIYRSKNNLTDDLLTLLHKAVKEKECIDWDYLYENITTLRMIDAQITWIDRDLLNFRRLRVLIIAGNWLSQINAEFLPRTLQYLECFANVIVDLTSLNKKPPRKLYHLGIGRNVLTNGVHLRLSGRMFRNLKSLDLSDNDICTLLDVLESLRKLSSLRSLVLEGNPCSTCIAYKDAVLSLLPQLIYLDNTRVADKDRAPCTVRNDDLINGTLIFACHRIMGLPAPPKQKGVIHSFHLEVALPLLDQVACTSKSPPVSKPPEGITYKSPYERPDEYKHEKESKTPEAAFKTSRMEWAKIIQFPEESISAACPELTLIRDTFRSKVTVKVIYLMVRPPIVPKGKPLTSPPQEEIVKKITLAHFTCELRSVNWSDKTVDFYWADHDACHLHAIPVEGSLRAITYVEGKPSAKKARTEDDANVEYLPSVLTVQVGFGLKRLESNAQQ